MALVLEFDAKNNILRGPLDRPLTDAILLDSYGAASRYTASYPLCRGLWDFSKVTGTPEVSNETVRNLVHRKPIIPAGYMRVAVAPQDFIFGMMRMLQILSEGTRPEVHVVRTIAEAYSLLGVKSPEFNLVSGYRTESG